MGDFGVPNVSAGGGGPSSASGMANTRGGQDGSGWMVNFGSFGNVTDMATAPAAVLWQPNAYGLPDKTLVHSLGVTATKAAGAVSLSPAMLAGLAVLALLLIKR